VLGREEVAAFHLPQIHEPTTTGVAAPAMEASKLGSAPEERILECFLT
jgi:hypothetical protein